MRTSRKELKEVFQLFCSTFGGRVATGPNDMGGLVLDYYNGYRIERIDNHLGGVGCPFGEKRRSAGAMADVMRFALPLKELNSPRYERASPGTNQACGKANACTRMKKHEGAHFNHYTNEEW